MDKWDGIFVPLILIFVPQSTTLITSYRNTSEPLQIMDPMLAFNTHEYVKELKAAGFTEEQAEVQANTLNKIIDSELATKQDLKELELRLKNDLTIRMGGMLVIGITIVATLVKIL